MWWLLRGSLIAEQVFGGGVTAFVRVCSILELSLVGTEMSRLDDA